MADCAGKITTIADYINPMGIQCDKHGHKQPKRKPPAKPPAKRGKKK